MHQFSPSEDSIAGPIRILYVDDEPDLLIIGRLYLEKTGGFQVDTIESAKTALSRILEEPYDAIISDYQMPVIDGIEFLKKVRESGDTIPFILFTGRGREEVAIQALNEGADYYIQKGGDPKSQFAELAHKVRLAVRQRRLEASLRDHEHLQSDILNFLPDATFAIDTSGVVIVWNQAIEQMTGIPAPDILGKGDYEYAIPFYNERRPMLINLALKEDPEIAAKYDIISRDGDLLSSEITLHHFNNGRGASFWFTARPLRTEKGEIIGAIEAIRDITESKAASQELNRKHEELLVAYEEIFSTDEELKSNLEKLIIQAQKLEEKENQLNTIASNIPGVIFRLIVNPEGDTEFEYISSRSVKILGIENDPLTFSEQLTNNIVNEDRERFLASIQNAIDDKTTWRYEGRYLIPSGEVIDIQVLSRPVSEDGRYVFDGIIFNITEWKQKDENLQFLAYIADESPASIMVHDFSGNLLFANEFTFRLHGYTRDEFFGLTIHELDAPESRDLIERRMRQIHEHGSLEFDVEHFHKDGHRIPLHVHVRTIEYEGKTVLLSIATDISDRKRYESELMKKNKELDQRIRLINVILETVPIGVFMVEAPSGRPLISNPAAVRLLGRGVLTDASEKNLSTIYEAYKVGTDEKYPTAEMPIVLGMHGRSSHIDDMEVVHPDGTKVLLEIYGNPIINSNGETIASIVSFIDITERKQVEKLLKESEESARALINAQKESIFMIKPDGTLLYANETMARRFGYTAQDIIGRSVFDIAPKKVGEGRRKYVEQIVRSKEEVHFIDERFGRVIENFMYPILDDSGEVDRIAIYGRDITESRESILKISENEEKYRNVVEQVHDGIIIIQDNRLVFANEAFARISGYDPGELVGMQYLQFVDEQDKEEISEFVGGSHGCSEKVTNCEIHLIKKDGISFTSEVSAVGIPYHKAPACLIVIRDITERKRAQELQKKTLNLLNEAQELTKLGGWEYDIPTRQISWTDEVYRIYGVGKEYDPNDLARNISAYTPEDTPVITDAFSKAVQEGVPYDLELRLVRGDGRQIWVRTMGTPVIRDGVIARVSGNIMDITQRKQLEQSYREAIQKLKMLTGITRHDVVNDLSIISLSLELLQDSEDEEAKENLMTKAFDAINLLNKTINFTREYEDFGSVSSQWQPLQAMISEEQAVISLCGISVENTIPSDIEVYSDPIIRKVFRTLFDNAVRHGGEDMSLIRVSTEERDNNLIVVFEDNGIGVPENEKELIFHHGFGKHTGIGLFFAREILAINSITIRECGVETEGARFEILVPRGVFRRTTQP